MKVRRSRTPNSLFMSSNESHGKGYVCGRGEGSRSDDPSGHKEIRGFPTATASGVPRLGSAPLCPQQKNKVGLCRGWV